MYKVYVDEIINMIFRNDDHDDIIFEKKSHDIGLEIYKMNGYKGLYIFMDFLSQELLESEFSNEYLSYITKLENSFNGICHEWN